MSSRSETHRKRFTELDQASRSLSRIGCLEACIDCLSNDLTLPPPVAYMPRKLILKSPSTIDFLQLFHNHKIGSFSKLVRFTSRHIAHVSGLLEYNEDGLWANLIEITLDNIAVEIADSDKLWILLCNFNLNNSLFAFLLPVSVDDNEDISEELLIESNWLEITDHCFKPFGKKDENTAEVVSSSPSYQATGLSSWSLEHDEQLCQLLSMSADTNPCDVVENITVSSKQDTKENLLTLNPDETWNPIQTGEQFIEFKLKPGVYIECLGFRLNQNKANYFFPLITVTGGTCENMVKLFGRPADHSYKYPGDELWLLKKQKFYLKIIRITLSFEPDYQLEPFGISGLLIVPQKSEFDCFNFFISEALSPYPKLQNIPPRTLYNRSILLKRVVYLYEYCLLFLYPHWDPKEQPQICQKIGQHLKHLLPLSSLRKTLAQLFIKKSVCETEETCYVTINRHLVNPTPTEKSDPKNSVFYQIYLQVKHVIDSYRFSQDKSSWWFCTFINEGINDQGGGFRDSMSNIAEELCPDAKDENKPIFSLFVPSPNQRNPDANEKDTYIPNSSCTEFALYKWIGQIMGACFRTTEIITFSFPKFFWMLFMGYDGTWGDYTSVDQKEVTDLALIERMDRSMFDDYFLDTRSWSYMLSNGTVKELKKGVENLTLEYEGRHEYVRLAKEARLYEFKVQVDAMREGFFEVVPVSAAQLYSLTELEEMICGRPVIPVEELKKHVKFISEHGDKQIFWKVMEKLTNEERSRFLKFTTGRRRLPVSIEIQQDEDKDILPTAATCSSLFHLPRYSSEGMALKMIQYAINSCLTIDTDH